MPLDANITKLRLFDSELYKSLFGEPAINEVQYIDRIYGLLILNDISPQVFVFLVVIDVVVVVAVRSFAAVKAVEGAVEKLPKNRL